MLLFPQNELLIALSYLGIVYILHLKITTVIHFLYNVPHLFLATFHYFKLTSANRLLVLAQNIRELWFYVNLWNIEISTKILLQLVKCNPSTNSPADSQTGELGVEGYIGMATKHLQGASFPRIDGTSRVSSTCF